MKMMPIFVEGKWLAVLEAPSATNEVLYFAATELYRYLELIAGESIPTAMAGLVPIRLELEADSHLPQDAYTIIVNSEEICLRGTTERGVLYAVYTLLEELGCLWTYPTRGEEIIPRRDELTLTVGMRTHVPSVLHRGLALYALYAENVELGRDLIDWMAKNRLNLVMTSADRPDEPTRANTMYWPEVAKELLPELRRRGIILELSEHMTHLFFPPDLFDEHPEWFALIDGRRQPLQMCFSNPEAVAFFTERLTAYAVGHPEVQILGTWPLDGGGYCECDGCKETGVPFAAVRHMAASLGRVNPAMTVEYLAYTKETLPLPVEPPHPNMSTLVCNHLDDLARGWTAHMRPGRGAYFFEYTLGDNYRWIGNVWMRPEAAVATAHAIRDAGYTGVVSLFLPIHAWWRSAFNTWFFARACWQGEFDVNAELDRYTNAYFGELAMVVRPLIGRVLQHYQDPVLLRAFHREVDPLYCEDKTIPTTDDINEALQRLKREATSLTQALQQLELQAVSESIQLQLRRWRTQVESFAAYYGICSCEHCPPTPGHLEAHRNFVKWVAALSPELAPIQTKADFVDWLREEGRLV